MLVRMFEPADCRAIPRNDDGKEEIRQLEVDSL
jgi:hypothetical protein